MQKFITLLIVFILVFVSCEESKQNASKVYLYKNIDSLIYVNLPLADSLSKINIETAEESNIDSLLVNSYIERTNVLISLGKFDEALVTVENGIVLSMKNNILLKYTICKNLKGMIKLQTGFYNESIKLFYEVLPELYKEKKFKLYIKAKANLGWAYFLNNQFDIAIAITKESLLESIKYKFDDLTVECNMRLGSIYSQQAVFFENGSKYIDTAFKYFNSCESYLTTKNDKLGLANLYLNIGGAYNAGKVYSQSILYYDRAIEIQKSLDVELEIGYALANKGLVYQKMKKYNLADSMLKSAQSIAYKFNNLDLNAIILKNLAVLYNDQGKFKESTQMYIKYIDIYTQNINEQTLKANNELYAKFLLEKKEKENTQLKAKKIGLEKDKQRLYWLSFTVVFVVLILIVVYIYKRRKDDLINSIKTERNKEIAIRNAEETERKRIANDLHDNLGAYASSILSTIDSIQTSESEHEKWLLIKNNASFILNNLKETVILLNNNSYTFIEIIDFFKSNSIKLLKNYQSIEFVSHEDFTFNKLFNAKTTVHFKSILSEIFQNSLKHSKCSKIELEIIENTDQVIITYKDNGIGFDFSTSSIYGMGLKNIKNRAEAIGLTIEFNSDTNKGVKIDMKLNKKQI